MRTSHSRKVSLSRYGLYYFPSFLNFTSLLSRFKRRPPTFTRKCIKRNMRTTIHTILKKTPQLRLAQQCCIYIATTPCPPAAPRIGGTAILRLRRAHSFSKSLSYIRIKIHTVLGNQRILCYTHLIPAPRKQGRCKSS